MSADSYLARGVSATKDDVHKAIKNQDKGAFPGSFCKIIDDVVDNSNYCMSMHADGAGTKSSLAYIFYKETGNIDVFKDISQDSLVMNIDDLLCIGAVDNFVVSNTIGRNAHRVSGDIIKEVIKGYDNFSKKLNGFGLNVIMSGGETADVGDLVSTLIVDSTVLVRLPRKKVVNCANIKPGNVIVGLSSSGQSSYEDKYNSGMSSNGLTASRHMVLNNVYAEKYPESFSNTIESSHVYSGSYKLEDKIPECNLTIGEALLSPTRTYAPVLKDVLDNCFDSISGIIHCTGGGQVKCKSFGNGLHYIKDDLFETPPIFKIIQEESKVDFKEMYQIFNMGHRMEIYCSLESSKQIIDISKKYNVAAKIIGRVEENSTPSKNKVTIKSNKNEYVYE